MVRDIVLSAACTLALNITANPANTIAFGSDSGESIGSSRGTSGQNRFGLDLYTAANKRLSITNGGNVGINKTDPNYTLEVNGTARVASTLLVDGTTASYGDTYAYYARNNNATNSGIASNPSSVSIRAAGRVLATEFNAYSDARLKQIGSVSNTQADLENLKHIEVTNYTMRDKVQYGEKAFKKVIAQQVEKVYPLAVSKNKGFVPSIYSTATLQKNAAGQTVVTLAGAHGLKAGDRLRLIGDTNGIVETEVLTVSNAKSFAVALPQSETKLFVYGPEVNDLRTVDYEAIGMLNVSATQELAKQVDELKAQNAKLIADNTSLKANLDSKASASTLNEMQAALQALRAEVQQLKGADAVASSK
ncbi:MAG: hypothetical protein EOO61_12835 [Hymenobacter sp.]|nr:MAG: hypothetical protein EOO61_12835 [Hymenobacter sp.]